ncbi:hypothetical protein [Prochlorothrix hollandica]|uniref:hypothetical protein n=1 Tax=Prochlorothrix hollandica TaxID=1223 RepID=UPI00034DD89C|nr:hypothetical protein [Prochlorothrix hollandica]
MAFYMAFYMAFEETNRVSAMGVVGIVPFSHCQNPDAGLGITPKICMIQGVP